MGLTDSERELRREKIRTDIRNRIAARSPDVEHQNISKDTKVLTLNDYINISRIAYSTLFKNRLSALHHYFCVIGNGHKWQPDGTLWQDNDEKYIKAKKAYENGAKPLKEKPGKFFMSGVYPISRKYANCFNYPPNIPEDWKDGIIEIMEAIKNSVDMEFTEDELKEIYIFNSNQLDKYKQTAKDNAVLAEEALKKLRGK